MFELGNGDIARGTVLAFEAGVLDVPFAPAACNAGKILPVRDNAGAIRVLEAGAVPFAKDILDLPPRLRCDAHAVPKDANRHSRWL